MKKVFTVLSLLILFTNKSFATECVFAFCDDAGEFARQTATLPNFLFDGFDVPQNLKTADGKPLIEVRLPPIELPTPSSSSLSSSMAPCSSSANATTLSLADLVSVETTTCKIFLVKAFNVFCLPRYNDVQGFNFPTGRLALAEAQWQFDGRPIDPWFDFTLNLGEMDVRLAFRISSSLMQTLPLSVETYMREVREYNIDAPIRQFASHPVNP